MEVASVCLENLAHIYSISMADCAKTNQVGLLRVMYLVHLYGANVTAKS